jgi:hypothetical protein
LKYASQSMPGAFTPKSSRFQGLLFIDVRSFFVRSEGPSNLCLKG